MHASAAAKGHNAPIVDGAVERSPRPSASTTKHAQSTSTRPRSPAKQLPQRELPPWLQAPDASREYAAIDYDRFFMENHGRTYKIKVFDIAYDKPTAVKLPAHPPRNTVVDASDRPELHPKHPTEWHHHQSKIFLKFDTHTPARETPLQRVQVSPTHARMRKELRRMRHSHYAAAQFNPPVAQIPDSTRPVIMAQAVYDLERKNIPVSRPKSAVLDQLAAFRTGRGPQPMFLARGAHLQHAVDVLRRDAAMTRRPHTAIATLDTSAYSRALETAQAGSLLAAHGNSVYQLRQKFDSVNRATMANSRPDLLPARLRPKIDRSISPTQQRQHSDFNNTISDAQQLPYYDAEHVHGTSDGIGQEPDHEQQHQHGHFDQSEQDQHIDGGGSGSSVPFAPSTNVTAEAGGPAGDTDAAQRTSRPSSAAAASAAGSRSGSSRPGSAAMSRSRPGSARASHATAASPALEARAIDASLTAQQQNHAPAEQLFQISYSPHSHAAPAAVSRYGQGGQWHSNGGTGVEVTGLPSIHPTHLDFTTGHHPAAQATATTHAPLPSATRTLRQQQQGIMVGTGRPAPGTQRLGLPLAAHSASRSRPPTAPQQPLLMVHGQGYHSAV